MALTVRLAPQSKGEAPTIGPWQEFPAGISGGIRLCWNSEFVLFVLSAIPQGTASHRSDTVGAAPHLLGMSGPRALLAGSLAGLSEPILGATRCSQRERVVVMADELDSRSTTSEISSASTRGVQHLRVRIDAVDYAGSFSVDFDQCSGFVGKIVTPFAEHSFCHFDFLSAMCESTIVSFIAALIHEVTWVEPHRWLLVICSDRGSLQC